MLDFVTAKFEDFRPFFVPHPGRYRQLGTLPMKLMIRFLRDTPHTGSGTNVAAERLYEWLGLVSDPGLPQPESQQSRVRSDLEWNPDLLKALISHGVRTCVHRGEECTDLIGRRLFGALPRDHGRWCLQMALAAKEGNVAAYYLQEALGCLREDARVDKLTVEGARDALAADAALLREFDQLLERRASIAAQPGRQAAPKQPTESDSPADSSEQRAWQAEVAVQAQALQEGRGSPRLLCRAAAEYLGLNRDSAQHAPRDRLRNLVGRRDDLLDLLLVGIESTVTRGDLPSCDDVVRRFDRREFNFLVLPFVAGLHSLEASDRLSASDLTDSQVRLAATILYVLPQEFVDPDSSSGTGVYRPEWLQTLLRDKPALVAEALHHSALRKLETGEQRAIELRELAEAEDHRHVARIVSLSVLESFPTAETDATLVALCWALRAALRWNDWSAVRRVIEKRLGKAGLAARERGCWLAAVYLVAPERFRKDLLGLEGDKDGLKGVATFVATGRFSTDLTRRLAPVDIEPLVASVGAAFKGGGLPDRALRSTTDLIGVLDDGRSAAATEALDALSKSPEAEPFLPAIAIVKERQVRIRRKYEYRHCDMGTVVATLDNGTPANAGDLAALLFNEIEDISLRIRGGSTSDWRQYWNVDSHNRPTEPKPEDAGRDTMLSDLQERLGRLGIDAQAEGVYADDKRSDIRVSFAGFNVPVEIKRSCHRDLWTAVRNQLIRRYTRDPGAGGYGIYVVFWFGDTENCRPRKLAGWVPATAEDVRKRIQDSLDDGETRLISVCVVDVSKP